MEQSDFLGYSPDDHAYGRSDISKNKVYYVKHAKFEDKLSY